MKLNNSALFRENCYINGQWVTAVDDAVLQVTNPANGEVLGTVPVLSTDQVRNAIAHADVAMKGWKSKTAAERGALLRRWYDLILENQEDLAQLMTAEQGKSLAEARGEVIYAASFIDWFAEEGKRVCGDAIAPIK